MKKIGAFVKTLLSVSASTFVNHFVDVHFSKTVKDIHFNLGVLAHHKKVMPFSIRQVTLEVFWHSYAPFLQRLFCIS